MATRERIREIFTSQPDVEYLREKQAAGWRLAAIEWERESPKPAGDEPVLEDLPYGLRVGPDCLHLQEDPTEKQAMVLMLEMIIQDIRLPEVAAELNRKGFHTRSGADWGPVEVFNLLPRLIEMGPRIFSSAEWAARRPRVLHAG